MNLRQWYADGFAQDTWRVTPRTTVNVGLRYEYMSALVDISRNWSNLLQQDGKLMVGTITEASTPGREFQVSARLSF
jgi:outer membrane receptor protein involved in Fe transport